MSSARPPQPIPRHFYSLDSLRGAASLAVVFWHWQHFFYIQGYLPRSFDGTQQPLYRIFAPLYEQGGRAVELFFCLSGFIFFWLYGAKVARKETSLKEFSLLRFSRLYPLHAATLLIVAVAQLWMRHRHGEFFVYPWNDRYHFALQLFLASHWGLERGYSFNGPIWSVSVEVLCYALFFTVCRLDWRRWWHLAPLVLLGALLSETRVSLVGHGIFSFFIGGLTFQLFTVVHRHLTWLRARYLAASLLLLWVTTAWIQQHHIPYRLCRKILGLAGLPSHGNPWEAAAIALSSHTYELTLFPATILILALWETRRKTLGKRCAWLGNISYSSYLLHFPLQILFFALAVPSSDDRCFFLSPSSLFLFFAALIPLSLVSYQYFERPLQSFIHRRAHG